MQFKLTKFKLSLHSEMIYDTINSAKKYFVKRGYLWHTIIIKVQH